MKVIVLRSRRQPAWRALKIAGLAAAGASALGLVGLLVARDQMSRHQHNLFSPQPLRRLAALGYLRSHPGVDNVLLLRDYLAWEGRPILRRRAAAILAEMEEDLSALESAEEA